MRHFFHMGCGKYCIKEGQAGQQHFMIRFFDVMCNRESRLYQQVVSTTRPPRAGAMLLCSHHILCAAPPFSMKITSKIVIKSWDFPLVREFDGFQGFFRYVDFIVHEKGMPFIPTVHQFVDAMWPTSNSFAHYSSVSHIYWISNHLKDYYNTIRIPKRDGTYRTLQVPNNELKSIQKWILRNILSRYRVSEYATAYKVGTSVLVNAKPHVSKEMILKLDIKNFFSSIKYDDLHSLLFDIYPKPIRHLLVHLCFYPLDDQQYGDMCLPQGAPTSPYIANVFMRGFDNYIGEYCRRHNISYTRYADDMTFSGAFNPNAVIEKVKNKLPHHLLLNEAKTQLIHKGQRQIVTGVVVNEKPQATSEFRRKIRQEMHYCRKYGIGSHVMYTGQRKYYGMSQYTDRVWVKRQAFLGNLEGRINFVLSINPDDTRMQEYREEVRLWRDMIKAGVKFASY